MSLLKTNEILVREHFGVSRVRNSYDILDARSGEKLGEAIEEASGLAMSFLKLTHWDSVVPFDIHFIEKETGVMLRIHRPWTFGRSKIKVYDNEDRLLGYFVQALWFGRTKFKIKNARLETIAKVTGNLFGWNFQFVDENKNTLASVGKNWSGFKNELLAGADTYAVKIDEEKVPKGKHALRILVLAAAVCIDMIYKQHER